MKKTHFIELINNIRRTRVAFISIMIFVALGVAIFLGFSWIGDGLVISCVNNNDVHNMHDLHIKSPIGLNSADMEKLADAEGVANIEDQLIVYDFFTFNDKDYQAKLTSITPTVDTLTLVDGRLPENDNEVAIDFTIAESEGIKVGDVITFNSIAKTETDGIAKIIKFDVDNDDIAELFAENEESVEYLTNDEFVITGTVLSPLYVNTISAKYGLSPTNGIGIDVGLYADKSAFKADAFEGANDILIVGDNLKGIYPNSDEYREKNDQFKEELAGIIDEIEADKRTYFNAKIDSIRAKVNDKRDEVLQQEEMLKQLNAMSQENMTDIEEALKSFDEIDEKLDELTNNQGLTDLHISNRSSVAYLNNVDILMNMTKKLRFSMAGLFFLIGILICYSALTRIIYSQIICIGTKKALGFSRRDVIVYYLLYGGCATVLGCVAGVLIGIICEKLLLGRLSVLFIFDSYVNYIGIKEAIIISILQLVVITIVSYIASLDVLRRRAIELLNDNTKPLGKRHFYEDFKWWEKLPLYNKIVVNNFVTDTKRVIGTVIGITGCTALIVTGMTFKRSIDKSYDLQFDDYYLFDNIVYFDPNTGENTAEEIEAVLDEYGIVNAKTKITYAMLDEPDGKLTNLMIYVPVDVEDFKKLVKLEPQESVDGVDPYDGIWGQYAYRNYYKDIDAYKFDVTTLDNDEIKVELDGFVKSHLTVGNMYASKEAYEQQFDDDATPNAFICKYDNVDAKEVNARLKSIDGYQNTNDYIDVAKHSFGMISVISDALAYIYIALAVILSVLMVYNLFVQFIEEKRKELIVMRINGFSLKSVYRYVYIDAIALTVIGVIFGTIVGCIMGDISVANFESSISYFVKTPDLVSCVTGIGGASIFTFIMCKVALLRVKNFSLSDMTK
ncbi:MAG: hypothetical protein KBT19_00025 [Lachnospiraceae bacterium]|nr:hypothetical protein [Candidatus Colinaster equi]